MNTPWLARASVALAACAAAIALAGETTETFRSGLQRGETTTTFLCRDVTGPNKGKSLCYV